MASRTVPQAQAETTASRMDALVLAGPGQFVVQQVDVPQPGRMELLCRVEAASICGTDQHIIEGHTRGRWPRSYPFIPGHEWAGTVAALGEGAELLGWKVDDRVAGTSHAGCGYCRMCRTGRYNLCENYGNLALHRQYGHYVNGAFAQYVVHSVKSVFPLAEALSFEEGAIVDTASIALWTVKRGKINAGDMVVILGPGAMGLLVAQCAAALGAG
ncbi:MAG: zinc-binding dehydrogenase, partial [Dehalococcoidia bacterium]